MLDPARQAVQVASVSPLRDLAPGSIPNMTAALRAWSDRCTSALGEVDAQIKAIRDAAATREKAKAAAQDALDERVSEMRDAEDNKGKQPLGRGKNQDTATAATMASMRSRWKRGVEDSGGSNADSMDVDEPLVEEEGGTAAVAMAADETEGAKRASKRKM